MLLGATPLGVAPGTALRVCVDLNFWESAFRAEIHGRRGTTAQRVHAMLAAGLTPFGPTQLVISQSMLTHLARNLAEALLSIQNKALDRGDADLAKRIADIPGGTVDAWVDSIGTMAANGPDGFAPLVFQGTSRVGPTLDPGLQLFLADLTVKGADQRG